MNQAVALSEQTDTNTNTEVLHVPTATVTFEDFKQIAKKHRDDVFTKSLELIQKNMDYVGKGIKRNDGKDDYIAKAYFLNDKEAYKQNKGICAVIRCKTDENETPYSLDVTGEIGSVDTPKTPGKRSEMFNTIHAYHSNLEPGKQAHQYGPTKAATTIEWAQSFDLLPT